MALASSCTAGEQVPSATSGTTTTTAPTTSIAASTTAPTTAIAAPADPAADLCSQRGVTVLGTVDTPALDEASGIVASRAHPGVLWSHNDGGDDVGVFAIGDDGRDLGFHPLPVPDGVDVEDIAMVSGTAGDDILLADIGDNRATRESIRIYRFAEPDPDVADTIGAFTVLEFTYPDRPHNAEALLVDEAANRVVIVTKEQALDEGEPDEYGRTEASFVFEGDLDGDGPVELALVGMLDAVGLELLDDDPDAHPAGMLGFGGIPTGGDVAADGTVVALRTYQALWLWNRRPGQTVVDALGSTPCQVTTPLERQGESVAFIDGGLVTLSEGVNQPLHLLAQ